jgi:peptidoglycan/xylan/chitin deacetylase (PgdA/CDA1 family)
VTPRTVVLTFDNLGEAAELEQGERERPSGDHASVTTALPRLLDALDELDLRVTFFVEGLNTELYPDAVAEIARRGHEVGMHGWLHERWAELEPAEEAEILARCRAAFAALGVIPRGFRPPGGDLGQRGFAGLREAGIEWCSPEGEAASVDGDMVVLPFRWQLVDATYLHPGFGALRRSLGLPEAALAPEDFEQRLWAELDALPADEPAVVILHPFLMLDDAAWAAERRILERLRERRVVAGGLLADGLR